MPCLTRAAGIISIFLAATKRKPLVVSTIALSGGVANSPQHAHKLRVGHPLRPDNALRNTCMRSSRKRPSPRLVAVLTTLQLQCCDSSSTLWASFCGQRSLKKMLPKTSWTRGYIYHTKLFPHVPLFAQIKHTIQPFFVARHTTHGGHAKRVQMHKNGGLPQVCKCPITMGGT